MGIYVEFWHGSKDGILGHFKSSIYSNFDQWLTNAMEEFPEAFDRRILHLFRKFALVGATAFHVNSAEESVVIDRLFETYYGIYLDFLGGKERASESMLSARRYRGILDALKKNNSPERAIELLEFVFSGRPVFRDAIRFPFNSEDGVYHIGYWNEDEVQYLQPLLRDLINADESACAATVEALGAASERQSGLIYTLA